MKKKVLYPAIGLVVISSVLAFFLIRSACFSDSVKIRIAHLKYELLTLPIGVEHVGSDYEEYHISNSDYLRIYSIVEKLKQVDEYEYDENYMTALEGKLDSIWEDLGFESSGNDMPVEKSENKDMEQKVVRKKYTELHLEPRYVIKFPWPKKMKTLCIGRNSQLIMMNGKFYSISEDDHKELLNFFAKLLGDFLVRKNRK